MENKKAPHLPFGGIQLAFSDFISPVGNQDEPDTISFCFEVEWATTF